MIDKTQDTEQLAEALMAAYAKELCRSQDAYLDGLEDDLSDGPPHLFGAGDTAAAAADVGDDTVRKDAAGDTVTGAGADDAGVQAGAGDRRRRGSRGGRLSGSSLWWPSWF